MSLYSYLHTDDPPETFRNELKYVCPEGLLQLIQARISPICPLDAHTAPGGIYSIRSVYFDDSRDRCFYENEDGPGRNSASASTTALTRASVWSAKKSSIP